MITSPRMADFKSFAENPKLTKMLLGKEILDTIDRGVRDGAFVASLIRPDRSVKTCWRYLIDAAPRSEPALELSLPEGEVRPESVKSLSDVLKGIHPGLQLK